MGKKSYLFEGKYCYIFNKFRHAFVQSTDHTLISAGNVSLVAMQGSASISNVSYYPT
jgi:hypothetical protein